MIKRSNRSVNLLRMVGLAFLIGCSVVAPGAVAAPASAQRLTESNPACKPAFDALDKLWSTPYHMFMTESGTAHKTPKSSESISVGGVHYLNLNGRWLKSRVNLKGMQEVEQENRKTNNTSCRPIRNEAVRADLAVVYTVREEHPDPDDPRDIITSDSTLWISKASGLILKSEINIVGGGIQQHVSNRYEYSDVHAPNP